MRTVCEECVKNYYSAGKPASGEKLKNVAHTFAILQQQRHPADYDVSFHWNRTDASGQLDLVSAAFEDWRAVRTQDDAQDFLPALLFPRAADILRSSQGETKP